MIQRGGPRRPPRRGGPMGFRRDYPPMEDPAVEKATRSIFVANVSFETTEEQLKVILSEVGPVVSLKLIYDPATGRPRGFGFCEYEDGETAMSAVRNLAGREVNGRPLRIDSATNAPGSDTRGSNMPPNPHEGPIEPPLHGPAVPPEAAPEAITKAVASLPPEQMYELMKQLKWCIERNPEETRQLLLHNPQLAYAILQAQVVMRIVDLETAQKILHRDPRGPALHSAPEPPPPPQAPPPPPPTSQPSHGPPGPPGPPRPQHQQPGPSRDPPPPPPPRPHPPPHHQPHHPQPPPPHLQRHPSPPQPRRDSPGESGFGHRERFGPPHGGEPPPRRDEGYGRGPPGPGPHRGPPPGHHPSPGPGGRYRAGPMRGPPESMRGGPPRSPPHQGPPRGGPPRSPPRQGPPRGGPPRSPTRSEWPPPPGPSRPPQHGPPAPGGNMGGLTPQDQEKAALIMQVLSLNDEQIQMLPPDQRNSILKLKEQISQSN